MLTSNVNLKEEDDQANSFLNQNIIRKTRKIISHMTEKQKFQKAKAHIIDSLNYKQPRFESQCLETPDIYRILYCIQASKLWEWALFILGYVYMYMVILDNQEYKKKIIVEALILATFWADNIFLFYCKSFDKAKYSSFFIFKNILILLMTIDLFVFIALPCYDSRPIRPFRILRAFIPILFDPELRKSLFSLGSAYKDVLVYVVFYTFVIVGWALIGCKTLKFDPTLPPNMNYTPQYMDPYKSNYSNLGSMIFVVYVTATYDSFPDNQVLAVQNSEANFIYFVLFVFLNMFLFSSIPGSLIYLKFRQTRSKIILLDEIKQQHSLLLAFVTLAQNQKDLSIEKLVKFLLFLYKFKIRYIEYITDICLRLDDNNNKSIQVNEFMQLSKILLQNSAMLPPHFEDIQLWIDFRKFVNTKLHLKQVIQHIVFQLLVTIIILLSFVNAIFLIFYGSQIAVTFDAIFIFVFLAELLIRIIAIGPQNFFNDRWNNVDALLVIFGLVFYFIDDSNTGAGSITRMSRIFRIASLLRVVSHSNYMKKVKLQIFQKIKNIFGILLQIFPIIFKFFPIFLFFFYIFSIFGMEVFYNSYSTKGLQAYNNYSQYSTFKNIFHAHYIMVQVLTEAGWSQVAFDHGWRNAHYYAYVMLYFILMHLVITYIVATLIRGIFWEVFFTVNATLEQRRREGVIEEIKQEEIVEKTAEFNEINQLISKNQYIIPNTIIKRNLVQSKLDLQIFKRLKYTYQELSGKPGSRNKVHHRIRSKRGMVVQKMIGDWKINIKDLEVSEDIKQRYMEKSKSDDNKMGQSDQSLENTRKLSLNDIEEVDEQDFESEFQDLLDGLIISPKVLFNEIVAYPKTFVDFLKQKFVKPETLINQYRFNLNQNPLYNQQSMYYHIYQIHAILGIETSKRQQKAMIIQSLYNQNIITEETVQKLIKKKLNEKILNIDTNGTLRKLFLSETNQQLIKKFEVQYFSDLYGYSFKHINKLTLQPLIKFQATLTYSLRNILRYPQIDNTQFFEMFTHIQDRISNRLLKRGSLFKFVYKIDHQSDIWFSIEYKKQQEMRVHFIKTGIWAYTKDMVEQQVYYARDMFKWDLKNRADSKACEQYLKRFYQSFEGLAFSLLDENEFFRTNPVDYVYDLYIQFFDVQKINRYITKKLQISKIMVVILSKQQEREDIGIPKLQYSVSDIIVPEGLREKKHTDFTFDESDNETYEKLKNIAALDVERIVESQGLPFSYIVNLMKQISDILKISSQNFIFQIEKVLNDQYEEVNMDKKQQMQSPV